MVEVLREYLNLLQVAAVTVVACVLIVGALGDLFANEPTGIIEPGDGSPIFALKYRGWMASTCRSIVMVVALFLTSAYTTLLGVIIWSSTVRLGQFGPGALHIYFIVVVSATIMAVCWIALLATFLRWSHMRRGGQPSILSP